MRIQARSSEKKAIGRHDRDDVDLLALAFGIPVWSNDTDLNGAGVWYTMPRLLRRLGV
jgi:hypothetical protein